MNNIISIENQEKKKLSDIFPKQVFWDVDLDNFSLDNWEDRSFIIQRVLKRSGHHGRLLNQLEQLFSIEEIKFYANDSMEIMGNELIENLCKRYHMQPSQFPYYINNLKKQVYA